MSQLTIIDLDCYETVTTQSQIKGGGIITPNISNPTVSTDAATAADTRLFRRATISGNLEDGFKINIATRGSAAAATATAVSYNGRAKAFAFARA